MKIAVRGGGMYGCVIADVLQDEGYSVSLYEAAPDILMGASFKNFRRLHRGFHYPLSMETALESNAAHDLFIERYKSHTYSMQTTYWIADDSKVTVEDYLEFVGKLDPYGTEHELVTEDLPVNNVSLGVGVTESMYNVITLRRYFNKKLNVKYTRPRKSEFVIDCTYSQSPLVEQCEYKEATILHIRVGLPKRAQTVLYGPYCGLIPALEGDFLFYHAALNNPREMLEDGEKFFPELANASVLEVRDITHVRPPSENDHRPYWMKQTDDNEICVLGGKIAQSIDCSGDVSRKLKSLGIVPNKRKAGERKEIT